MSLLDSCYVNTNKNDDRFVGIKEVDGKLKVCFPLGYHLSSDEGEIKKDIHKLLQILKINNKKKNPYERKNLWKGSVKRIPITAYQYLILDFLSSNERYYTERELNYNRSNKGKVDWKRTVRREKPIFQDGKVLYTNFIVSKNTPNENRLITHIHKHCVYNSFKALGWLYTDYMPQKPEIPFQRTLFLQCLNQKLQHTHNDKHKTLFKAMLNVIKNIDETPNFVSYGTDNFEYVWENMINEVYGIKNKDKYFPKTTWTLYYSNNNTKDMSPLIPDTIMFYEDKIYILDAKYYKFGCTNESKDLPSTSSIAKQIVYGDYINKKFPEYSNNKIYNAFVMPYDKSNNTFGLTDNVAIVGEAIGKWNHQKKYYEKIQGVVLDTRYLMDKYLSKQNCLIEEMASKIEDAVKKHSKIQYAFNATQEMVAENKEEQ